MGDYKRVIKQTNKTSEWQRWGADLRWGVCEDHALVLRTARPPRPLLSPGTGGCRRDGGPARPAFLTPAPPDPDLYPTVGWRYPIPPAVPVMRPRLTPALRGSASEPADLSLEPLSAFIRSFTESQAVCGFICVYVCVCACVCVCLLSVLQCMCLLSVQCVCFYFLFCVCSSLFSVLCVCVYFLFCVCVCVYFLFCVCVCVCVCVFVCVYFCSMCVWVCVSIVCSVCVCFLLWVCVYVWMCIYCSVGMRACTEMRVRACVRTLVLVYREIGGLLPCVHSFSILWLIIFN